MRFYLNKIPVFKMLSESLGSFLIAFCGALGAFLSSTLSFTYVEYLGGVFSGVTLACCIYWFTTISGAHVNPAITIAFWILGRIESRSVPFYLIAQFMGSILAGMLLYALLGPKIVLGLNYPAYDPPYMETFFVEMYVSATMMLVILFPFTKKINCLVPSLIGLIVAVNIWLFGATHGAAMNPIRAVGPILYFPDYWGSVWIYLIGPVVGCALVSLVFHENTIIKL